MGLALRQAQAVQKLEAYSKTKGKIQKNTQKVQKLDKFGKFQNIWKIRGQILKY